uniref:Putative ATP-dependent deoxyribonuclease (Subunit B) n=1 Tax=Magnetococcus massalia (strain MO-1) TaxID=451514 RepID=A0A1S7LFD5_MAGMO|nr:Putative ATP-dependent deoxyribonuclease (subunit B) [Candidatus Magnetococcus massalia]
MNTKVSQQENAATLDSHISGDEALFNALGRAAVVVTVNRRLARWLGHRYGEQCIAAGEQVWTTPELYAWGAWLERSWQVTSQLVAVEQPERCMPRLLGAEQERLVWQQVVEASEPGQPLLNKSAAADAARQGWELLLQWQLPPEQLLNSGEVESAALYSWGIAFAERCRAEGWITRSQLPEQLLALWQESAAVAEKMVPKQLLAIGFDHFPPQLRSFLEQGLSRLGGQVSSWSPEPLQGVNAQRRSYADSRGEMLAMSSWVRRKLEQEGLGNIGIVVPDLPALAPALRRTLEAVLQPGSTLPGAAVDTGLLNLSSGEALSHQPVVATALDLLKLMAGEVLPGQWSSLLHSPFWIGGEQGARSRAVLDAKLRKQGCYQLDLCSLAAALGRVARKEHPFVLALNQLQQRWIAQRGQKQAMGSWAQQVSEWLESMGWPGPRTPSSSEFQAITTFRDLLAEWAALEHMLPAVGFSSALGQLLGMAQRRAFQPDGGESPVRVMGVLESAGERFDALWILDMRDQAWPPSPAPNPFLPFALQRQYAMPRASSERELAFASVITQRLLTAAPEVVVSWPRSDGDNPLRISPLLAELPLFDGDEPLFESHEQQILQARQLEAYAGDEAGPFPPEGALPGGASLLKAQAQCPFQAFARYRLRADQPEESLAGVDGRKRGELGHGALAAFWQQVKDDKTLRSATEQQLAQWLSDAVEQALQPWLAQTEPTEEMQQLERRRMQRLLARWVEVELARPEGFTVELIEESQEMTLAGRTLQVRLDRVDRLADGRRILIDYKSSKANGKDWLGERPKEPQLPLYTLLEGEAPSGLAFASMDPADQKEPWVAMGEEEGLLPKMRGWEKVVPPDSVTSWGAVLKQWRQTLTELAEAFIAGEAAVDPDGGEKGCGFCDLSALCRRTTLMATPQSFADDEDGHWEEMSDAAG